MYKNVKLIRLERGPTQSDVSMVLNISRTTYARYEKANSFPAWVLCMLSQYCGVSSDFFVGITDIRDRH